MEFCHSESWFSCRFSRVKRPQQFLYSSQITVCEEERQESVVEVYNEANVAGYVILLAEGDGDRTVEGRSLNSCDEDNLS